VGDTFDNLFGDLVIGSARGRRPAPAPVLGYVRELNAGDIHLLLNPPPQGLKSTPLVKLRHQHHMLARLLAEGRKPQEVMAITGYSGSRISILQNDPAFKELVAYYQSNTQEVYLDMHSRLATLGEATIEELRERLEDNPEGFSQKELMALAELTLDRSVAPPKGVAQGGRGGAPAGGPPTIHIEFVTPKVPEGVHTHPTVTIEMEPPE
jgi:hypothetical protein